MGKAYASHDFKRAGGILQATCKQGAGEIEPIGVAQGS